MTLKFKQRTFTNTLNNIASDIYVPPINNDGYSVLSIQGNQGFPGMDSIEGLQGTQGFQGVTNISFGVQGTQGPQGPIGSQGTQGPQGFQGNRGNVGFRGTQGSQGDFPVIDGVQGNDGFQGNVGFQGGFTDVWLMAYQSLGSKLKSISPNVRFLAQISTGFSLLSNRLWLCATYIPSKTVITGVTWYQIQLGRYTAGNYNGVALYSQNNGTLTLIASSTNNSTLWGTSTVPTETHFVNTQAFSSPISPSSGTYYIGVLYTESSELQTVQIGARPSCINSAVLSFNMTNSNKLVAILSSQTSLPTTISMSSTTSTNSQPFFALY